MDLLLSVSYSWEYDTNCVPKNVFHVTDISVSFLIEEKIKTHFTVAGRWEGKKDFPSHVCYL